ncbi:MAG: DUF6514 family protein [Oscillospiraceae bacterium]|nr:DUF6514 family protein [Oscillospiraceae bacterium]
MLLPTTLFSEFNGFKLKYYIIHTRHSNGFGVGIKCQSDDVLKVSECYNFSTKHDDAVTFLNFLAKNNVFPSTLNCMVEDWLYDQSDSSFI